MEKTNLSNVLKEVLGDTNLIGDKISNFVSEMKTEMQSPFSFERREGQYYSLINFYTGTLNLDPSEILQDK